MMINKIQFSNAVFKGYEGDRPRIIKAKDVRMSDTPYVIGGNNKKDEFTKEPETAEQKQPAKSAEEIALSVQAQSGIDAILASLNKDSV